MMPPAVSAALLAEPDQATGELYRSALCAMFGVAEGAEFPSRNESQARFESIPRDNDG